MGAKDRKRQGRGERKIGSRRRTKEKMEGCVAGGGGEGKGGWKKMK